MMRGGMEWLSVRRYLPGAVHRTGAKPSSRPVVGMIGKTRVAANLVAAVNAVSHVRLLLCMQVDDHLVRPSELFPATLAAAFVVAMSRFGLEPSLTPSASLSRLFPEHG
jgi:hypothetical protein